LDSQQILAKPASRSAFSLLIDFVILLIAIDLLVAFQLPWANLDSGWVTGAGFYSRTSEFTLLLIPALSLVALLMAVWSIINPQSRRGFSTGLAICGAAVLVLLAINSALFLSRGSENVGIGVWAMVVGGVLLIAQMVIPSDTTRQSSGAVRTWLSRTPEASASIGFMLVFLFFTTTSPLFLQLETMSSILVSQATAGIAAIGITMLMISGEFDLSVGSTLAVSALIFLQLVSVNVPAPLAAIVGVLTGLALGLINGLLLVWTRIPSFIVTLGTLQAYRAIALTAIRGGRIMRYADYFSEPPYVYFHPVVIILIAAAVIAFLLWLAVRLAPGFATRLQKSEGILRVATGLQASFLVAVGVGIGYAMIMLAVQQLGNMNTLVRVDFFDLLNGRLNQTQEGNFRMSMIWWTILVAIFTIILTQTRYGNAVFATGGNPGAARAQGIPVDSVRILNFVISGGLAAIAGVIAVGREQVVNPLQSQGLELEVIAAAVIGGTLLSGGYGSIIGALLGVLITGMLRTGLVQLRVPAEIFQGAIGVILIVTVVVNTAVRGQSSLINLRWLRRIVPGRRSSPEISTRSPEAVKQ
jgi:ribose/xylose/arabinose/galactoside ABC-type transport system permease subunit